MHETGTEMRSLCRKARPSWSFPRLPGLGVLFVIGGSVISFTGFVNGWEASITGRDTAATAWGIVTITGLATIALGAGVLVWGAVAVAPWRGPLAAVLAGMGGLGTVILLALATYVTLAGGNVGVAVATGLAVVVVVGVVLLRVSGGEMSAPGRKGRC